ncbi:hypothetical protein [Anaerosphaera multitolerans]|uniref:Anti-sigma factor RsgI-like middle domain-containing protein n=1 Tax=Anaerosphaera multitolerans TaxID=2487351 RepID=A0A437S5M0_9FIRM|nr:hypothetical protein [Anaerosphaera multitolerans]RVU54342.1 hypothetical protein EF514_07805 [Anaerosphaera multitolerans]
MKYLIVEVHPAYVVALDEEGRFLRAANLNYEVGSTVEEIVPLEVKERKLNSRIFSLLASVACICIVAIGVYRVNFMPYGTVNLKINPSVAITLNKREKVLKLEGKNKSGEELIGDYDIKGKNDIEVIEDLADRALEREILKDDGKISVVTISKNAKWKDKVESNIIDNLNLHLENRNIKIYNEDFIEEEDIEGNEEKIITIPVVEPSNTVKSTEPTRKEDVIRSSPKVINDGYHGNDYDNSNDNYYNDDNNDNDNYNDNNYNDNDNNYNYNNSFNDVKTENNYYGDNNNEENNNND